VWCVKRSAMKPNEAHTTISLMRFHSNLFIIYSIHFSL
jgi:hypothetical protein